MYHFRPQEVSTTLSLGHVYDGQGVPAREISFTIQKNREKQTHTVSINIRQQQRRLRFQI